MEVCFTALAGSSLGSMAPVGQAATQEPQEVQMESAIGSSPYVPINASCPRPSIAIAPICCRSWHASTQRPQRMQSSISTEKKGLLESVWSRARVS